MEIVRNHRRESRRSILNIFGATRMFKRSGWIFGTLLLVGLILSAPVQAAEPLGGKDLTEDMNIPGVVAKVNGVELKSDYIRFRVNLDLRRIGQNLNAQQKAKLAQTIIDKEIVRELMYQEGQAKGSGVSSETIEKEMQEFKKPMGQRMSFKML